VRSRNPLWLALPLLLLSINIVSAQSNRAALIKLGLNNNWQFREADKDTWYPASVPGSVHTDLLKNKVIEDPFYRDNESKQQWIGKTNWEYRTTFTITDETLTHKNQELVFDGLDTYADVYLNDKLILKADNMFRTWRISCAGTLKSGDNNLRIVFRSPINEILPLMGKMAYQLPASNDQGEKTSPWTRKAPYQYGWDWGPRFVTSGIWKPVTLEAWDDARVSDLHIVQNKVSKEQAALTAQIDGASSSVTDAELIVEDTEHKTTLAKQTVKLATGANHFAFDFNIANPALWWPNGLGEHPLYSFKARLLLKGQPVDERSVRTGLRSLQIRQEKDEWGLSLPKGLTGFRPTVFPPESLSKNIVGLLNPPPTQI
jgi:beta-mannosidase